VPDRTPPNQSQTNLTTDQPAAAQRDGRATSDSRLLTSLRILHRSKNSVTLAGFPRGIGIKRVERLIELGFAEAVPPEEKMWGRRSWWITTLGAEHLRRSRR
jgi:hypothetical protein